MGQRVTRVEGSGTKPTPGVKSNREPAWNAGGSAKCNFHGGNYIYDQWEKLLLGSFASGDTPRLFSVCACKYQRGWGQRKHRVHTCGGGIKSLLDASLFSIVCLTCISYANGGNIDRSRRNVFQKLSAAMLRSCNWFRLQQSRANLDLY